MHAKLRFSRRFPFAGFLHLPREFRAKKYFTDHHTPNAVDGFGDLVLVCKMRNSRIRNVPFLLIQAMQAITINKMGRLDENKPL